MELVDVINTRKSIRAFEDKDVPNEILDEIINIARRCPSAGAIRGYSARITREKLAYNAPVCIVIFTDPLKYSPRYGARGTELYSIQDATIFASYIQLLLVDYGLSSVWVGAFREDRVKRLFNTDLRPIAILALGYKQSN